ncbi:MAG TPA: glyoxalase, partial [Candidatus Rifleibacterium sp.]|nr:glyoxalase [Candidatus Rifleibacterium sp.]
MIKRSNIILYVSDQQRSRDFYSQVLQLAPTLDVPGMTEFAISDTLVLGLMPEKGIVRLLGNAIKDPALAGGIPRAELYLSVDQPQ